MKIISWNVAGIRACEKKGLLDFMKKENADIYCFQEIKADLDNLSAQLRDLKGYLLFHSIAEKKGYSGLLTYTRKKPLSVKAGLGIKKFDSEARTLTLEFSNFYLVNAYFPHSNRELKRLSFKLEFNKAFDNYCKRLGAKKPVIVAGDFNVAHTALDLANPKQNEKNAGFTIQERTWFDSFLKTGYIDTFREFVKDNGHYTWWTYRNNARQRNIGWRVDYFLISKRLRSKLKNSSILKGVPGSDHCPIRLEISL